ncbi:type VI secretion system-associated protein VasI [Vibrio sp. RC586]|uniref:type VI secretion system-associated protein VasI n=1 Tax=Vibrio sp. RC586 TaxID=675815 RepID=UPI0002E5842E|nr:type VI secretion system-associated protein VasI [Vibrio sp. RC586]
MNTSLFAVSLIFSSLVFTSTAQAQSASLIDQAEQCRTVSARLERLACFDRVFATPLDAVVVTPMTPYPTEWKRAMAALKQPASESGWFLVTDGEGKGSSAWVALPAQNRLSAEQTPAVLLLSCINNLSRIELALPQEREDARIQISIRQQTQFWRSDDHGVLFSSARGMPAIEMMKLAASEPRLLLRSNAPFADGLQFDTRGVNEALDALRERCGW